MWLRSLTAMLIGCLLSISLVLNLNYLLPFSVDNKILVGLLVSFPLWCTACLFCYACENSRKNWLALSGVFVTSSLCNGVFFLS